MPVHALLGHWTTRRRGQLGMVEKPIISPSQADANSIISTDNRIRVSPVIQTGFLALCLIQYSANLYSTISRKRIGGA